MKNFNHKINFLFRFSVIIFIIANLLHFLIIRKEKKEAQAAGVLSIAGVTGTSILCSPPPVSNCGIFCNPGLMMTAITQRFGGYILTPPLLCLLPPAVSPTGLPLYTGRSLLWPGTTFMGLFTSVSPAGVVQAGVAGGY